MSTGTPAHGPRRPGGGHDAPAGSGPRSRFEVRAWVFMRVSGVILLFMVVYHLIWWNLVVGVEHLSAEVVLERWNQPLWRLFNVGLVTFALLHGLNGARYSIEDYVRGPRAQRITRGLVYTVVLLTLAWGVFALLTFDFTRPLRRAPDTTIMRDEPRTGHRAGFADPGSPASALDGLVPLRGPAPY